MKARPNEAGINETLLSGISESRDFSRGVVQECIDELVNEFGEITESEKLDLELLKEAFTYQLFKEVISEKDEKFVLDNLDLYKKLIKSVFKEDENEIKKCLIELIRAKNESC